MNNLVIGIASGYSWREVEPFIVSLRRYYRGRCLLILGDGPHDTPLNIYPASSDNLLEKLEQFGIEVFDLGKFTEHPILIRFPTIAGILGTNTDLNYVLACDSKDIFFQSNPFLWLDKHLEQRVLCAVEEGLTYANSWGNKNNVRVTYGQEVLNTLWKYKVLNGGVIAGQAEDVRQLCDAIYKLCKQDRRLANSTPGYNEMLPDQTALNIILRNELADKTFVSTVKDGFCYLGNHGEVRVADGLVYRPGSQVPYSIVHQYFRLDAVVELVNQTYREIEKQA